MSQGLLIYHLLPELCYLAVCVVLSHWKRSLNGLSYCNLRCCLSARGYSPTAGSVEESVPATAAQPQPFVIWCELQVKLLMVPVNTHAVKSHNTGARNAFIASTTKSALSAEGR